MTSSVKHFQYPSTDLTYTGVLARGTFDEPFLGVSEILLVLLRVPGFVDSGP